MNVEGYFCNISVPVSQQAMAGKLWRLRFLLSLFKPPATYGAIAASAHLCQHPSTFASIFLFILTLMIFPWYYIIKTCARKENHNRNNSRVSIPAYASVVGHFATAVTTYIIKLLPVMKVNLSIVFLTSSCGFGYYLMRVITSNPGYVNSASGDAEETDWRAKHCHHCSAFIRRYDHHCAAVQNCIGIGNHRLFLLLLAISCLTEIVYVLCSSIYLMDVSWQSTKLSGSQDNRTFLDDPFYTVWQIFSREAWVFTTSIFVALQIVWQVPFLIFHIYLVSVNLTTHEWMNWEKLPTFYEDSGSSDHIKNFVNPYDEGCGKNLKAMLQDWR